MFDLLVRQVLKKITTQLIISKNVESSALSVSEELNHLLIKEFGTTGLTFLGILGRLNTHH